LPTDRFLIPGTRKEFGDGNIADMTSPGLNSFKELLVATRAREQEIKSDLKKAKWQLSLARFTKALGWMSLTSAVIPAVRQHTAQAVEKRQFEVSTLVGNLVETRISVNFNMETEVAEPYRRTQNTFDQMAASHRIWSIYTEQQIDRVKARSTAGTVVSRTIAMFRRQATPLVDTEDAPLLMSVRRGRSNAYFYPGFVLIDGDEREDFALIDFTELNISSRQTNFTESEGAPADSHIVGKTWAKANKDGSRDRRFKDNMELPILRYGSLSVTSSGGMNESFMFSNAKASDDFARAANQLKQVLSSGRSGRFMGNQQRLNHSN
jgi:hypothetical protein